MCPNFIEIQRFALLWMESFFFFIQWYIFHCFRIVSKKTALLPDKLKVLVDHQSITSFGRCLNGKFVIKDENIRE